MATLSLKLSFGNGRALGPGKIRLLELIAQTGSISAAGREMRMSYRRAWSLVDDLNGAFKVPLVSKQTGGSGGGGAALTPLGANVVRHYRAIEARISTASKAHLAALERAVG